MSPDLFNLHSQMLSRVIFDEPDISIDENSIGINNLRNADDTILIADSIEKLQIW